MPTDLELIKKLVVELGISLEEEKDFNDSEIYKGAFQLNKQQRVIKLALDELELKEFPEIILQFEHLQFLSLHANKLSSVPKSIGNLTNLTTLFLESNQLSSVPGTLGNLTNLTILFLQDNQLNSVPETLGNLTNLTTLFLQDNQLNSVPETLGNLKDYCDLNLNNNPLQTPPVEIATSRGNVEKIRNYFAQLKAQQEDYLFEAKLLIVGEPGAGKTSMACKLQNKDCDLPSEKDTTRGIEVKQYYFPLREEDFPGFPHPHKLVGERFRLNLWDFGGQEIYKATHRFFLSKRSLYALVADSRNEDTDFNYWLHIVEMFGGESPLLIILNEKHGRERHLDIPAMKKRFSNIKDVYTVDFADSDHERLDKLARAVKYFAVDLPHIGSPVPANWTKVREALEQEQRQTISRQDYLAICRENGIEKREDALLLSQYFHDIGVFLHFQEDALLRKTIFLKPNWATNAVYQVLDDELLRRRNGRFSKSDTETIWADDDFEPIRDELLRLMEKFFLTYEIDRSGEYIVPERLPNQQPAYDWDTTNNLFLRYNYDVFMPKGIMSQTIVQLHRYINDHEKVWKRGVMLERENTPAEIIESYDARNIEIRVSGQNRRDFMTIISETIDGINEQFEKMKVEKLIPCNCETCKEEDKPHLFPYRKLMKRLNDRVDHVECDNSYERIHIRSLMDEVINPTRPKDRPSRHSTTSGVREKVFVSYSHKDKDWLARIQPHLKVLEHEGIAVNLWDDTKIKPGMAWREEIEKALAATKVAILLVSTDFLASDFIMKKELPELLEAAKDDGAVVIPLIIKPCRFSKNKTLREIQSVNPSSEALSGLSENEQDKVLVALADRVAEILDGDE